jgi:hypothetical protein
MERVAFEGQKFVKRLHEFESLRRKYRGHHLLARGHFCCGSDNFKIEGEE